MKSLRDEIRLRREIRTDLISSALADFIRACSDFIAFARFHLKHGNTQGELADSLVLRYSRFLNGSVEFPIIKVTVAESIRVMHCLNNIHISKGSEVRELPSLLLLYIIL